MTRDLAQYVEMSDSEGTTIIRVVDPQVLSDDNEALYSLADGTAGRMLSSQVVLSLEHVRSLKSVMLATLINFQKKIKEKGGSLKICSIDPDVLRLFELTHMDQLLDLRKDEKEALESFRSPSAGWLSRLFGSR